MTTPQRPKVGFYHMMRDIFVTAINKGQFVTALLGLILLVVFFRLPVNDLSNIVKDVIDNLKNGVLLGYLLFIFSLIGWYIHAKRSRTIATLEEKRIGNEKSKLQEKAGLGNKVVSSKNKATRRKR